MNNKISQRLRDGLDVLETLDERRAETHSPRLGYDTEYEIVDRELREIENNILEDPGALEPFLVRKNRNGH
jgi:hypothetical protein